MTGILDIAVLSVSEESTALVLAEHMCGLAERTGLYMITKGELPSLPPQRASVCIVPYPDEGGEVKFVLLETFPERVNIRPMEVASDAGWSPKCPWLFKR